MKNLSRRTFLKVASALAALGALAWKPDEAISEADEILVSDEDWLANAPPFTPYYLEKPYAQYYENLMKLSYISGLEIGELSVKVHHHRWCSEAIFDYCQENGDFPDDF